MKKIFTLLIGIVFSITVLYAQEAPPQAFSFKATIQGANGQTVVNKMIRLRISILQDAMDGYTAYSEFFTPTTNHYSQVDVEIGRGNVLSGIFSSIDWSAHKYFLKVEVDAKGGTNYQLLSVTQLLSVPYALYAGSATHANESDPIFKSHPAYGFTPSLLNNGNTAYSWGNHASAGYLKSFTETDPIFISHVANGITNTLITNWNTAYGWGNHAGLYRPIGYVPAWTDITSKPTTLTGYGITDAMSTSHAANGITATNITNWNTAFNWGNHSGLYRPISYVPAWSEIIDKPTFATVATSGSYNDLNNIPTIDGSETKVTAGTNVTVTGVGTTASPYVISSTGGGSGSSHYIGESYGGGIIFYLDASGQHGLIAATTDQSTAIQWYNGSITNTTAFASSVGGGDGNTSMIVFNQGAGTYAAKLCYDLNTGGFTDWYLPSKYELNLMYHNIGQGNLLGLGNVGGFASNYYWSSTEHNNFIAWSQSFALGNQYDDGKDYPGCVRAVRAF